MAASQKQTRVEFDGTFNNFPKYEIQLKAALGMEDWTKALSETFKNELPAKESIALVETDLGQKAQIEAQNAEKIEAMKQQGVMQAIEAKTQSAMNFYQAKLSFTRYLIIVLT